MSLFPHNTILASCPGRTTATLTSSGARPPRRWRRLPSWSSWRRRTRMPWWWLLLTCGWTVLKWWKSSTSCSQVCYGTMVIHFKGLSMRKQSYSFFTLCFQAMQRCLLPVLFCVGTFLLLHMEKHRSNHSKVKLSTHNLLYLLKYLCVTAFQNFIIFLFSESLKALADAICSYPSIHSK